MKFVGVLTDAGFAPADVQNTARDARAEGRHLNIPRSELVCVALVKDADDAKLQELGQKAKANCPISRRYKGTSR